MSVYGKQWWQVEIIPEDVAKCESSNPSQQGCELFCVVACVFFSPHSPEKTQTSFGQKSVYLPVNVSQSRHNCVRPAVLSTSCLMFYALLSESDDTAADSPLSQQPLISIMRPFNLFCSSIYTLLLPSLPLLCLLSPNSRSFFFLSAELQRFGFILFLFFHPLSAEMFL